MNQNIQQPTSNIGHPMDEWVGIGLDIGCWLFDVGCSRLSK